MPSLRMNRRKGEIIINLATLYFQTNNQLELEFDIHGNRIQLFHTPAYPSASRPIVEFAKKAYTIQHRAHVYEILSA